jgi:hypothetical protein
VNLSGKAALMKSQLKTFSSSTSLSQLEVLDFSQFDLTAAHENLGKAVSGQVHRILKHKLARMTKAGFQRKIRHSRMILKVIQEKLSIELMARYIQHALQEYQDCLYAWCEGTGLNDFICEQHPDPVDGSPIQPIDLGILLQDEYSGCQTGTLRGPNGEVFFWHTEECREKKSFKRMDALRLFIYKTKDGRKISTFIYPDILPGPAFAWNDSGYVQLVDFLHLKKSLHPKGLIANVVSWITLLMGQPDLNPSIIKGFSPILDGYALFGILPGHKGVIANRVEFVSDRQISKALGLKIGSHLFQVNLFSPQSKELAHKFERNPVPYRDLFEARIKNTEIFLEKIKKSTNKLEAINKMLSSSDGGYFAYVNKDVQAHIYGSISPDCMEIHASGGAAKIINN